MTESNASIVALLGERATVLHGIRGEDTYGGGDVDCVVEKLDPLWPLRLTGGWRLCQVMQYDITGHHWVLERDGDIVAIDTLEDPRGLGKYSFATSQPVGLGARAAYLTSKRIRKGMDDVADWSAIGSLAAQAPDEYRTALVSIFGNRLSTAVAQAVLCGKRPPESIWRRARRRRLIVLLRRPNWVVRLAALHVRRLAVRLHRPTGFVVVVVGPDGAGKSTLAEALPGACEGLFRRSLHLHWRPGILPRPGAMTGRAAVDSTTPHRREPFGRLVSAFLIIYYWLDFAIGSLVRIAPFRRRSGLVIIERGWWDIVVDPTRYRLVVMQRLVTFLGHFLPKPDLVLLLDGEPGEMYRRKPELSTEEIALQLDRWRMALPSGTDRAVLPASSPSELIVAARSAILARLEARALRGLGHGWFGIPHSRPRWVIPRGRRQALAGMRVYNPVTVRARVGWELARAAASMGGLWFAPRTAALPEDVLMAVSDLIPRGGTFALAASPTYPGRIVSLLIDNRGRRTALAKVALDDDGCAALVREREAIERYGHAIPSPLRVPRLLDVRENALVFEAIHWRTVLRPWRLDRDVAEALGRFYALTGAAHGDCTPWNLLRVDDGWVLVDWEEAGSDAEPFADVVQHLVRSAMLLGRPKAAALAAGVQGRGWVARIITAYADGAGLAASEGFACLGAYLAMSTRRLTDSVATSTSSDVVRLP